MSKWDNMNDSDSSTSFDSDSSPNFSPVQPFSTSTSSSSRLHQAGPSSHGRQSQSATAGHKSFPSNWIPTKNTGKAHNHSGAEVRGNEVKKGRKKVAKACFPCQKSHLTCDEKRPCTRCVKKGMGDQCVEGVRKKAKYLLEDDMDSAPMESQTEPISRSPTHRQISPPIPHTLTSRPSFSTMPSHTTSTSTSVSQSNPNSSSINSQTINTQYQPYSYQSPYMPKLGFSESYPTTVLPNNGYHEAYDNPFPGFDTGMVGIDGNAYGNSSTGNNAGYGQEQQQPQYQFQQPASTQKPDVWLAPPLQATSSEMGRDDGDASDGYWAGVGGQGGRETSGQGSRQTGGGFPFTSAAVNSEYEVLDQMFASISPVFDMGYNTTQQPIDLQPQVQSSNPGQQQQQQQQQLDLGFTDWNNSFNPPPMALSNTATTDGAYQLPSNGYLNVNINNPSTMESNTQSSPVPWQTWTNNIAPSDGGPTPKASHAIPRPDRADGLMFSPSGAGSGSDVRTNGFLSAGPEPKGRATAITPSEVYRTILKPYDYTEGYHFLMNYLIKKFDRPEILRVVKSLASFRPSLIALQMPMSDEDGVFLERAFQRTLIELEKLISYAATPTAVWRRTGEICLASSEFCTLVGRSEDQLLKKKTYIYELLDKPSTMKYWELFSVHAFENTTQNFFQSSTFVTGDGRSLISSGCLTIRRDIFDLPSVVIGQFLPTPE